MTKFTENQTKIAETALNSAVKFDVDEFEKRLADMHQEFNDELKQSVLYKDPGLVDVELNFNLPEAAKAIPEQIIKNKVIEVQQPSSLLASLALEAEQSQLGREALDQDTQARHHAVHDALERVFQFSMPFTRHANTVEPNIKRAYRLDARSVFANLKWHGGVVDSRKQSISDSALRSYVSFSVNLLAPAPILLKRPWEQFEALKKELHYLKLRALDDLDVIHKKPKQEWLETYLEPALPVQIIFQGNYDLGKIDILSRNLADFGQSAFRLAPEQISAALLDELGLFLIGRSDKPPPLLCVEVK